MVGRKAIALLLAIIIQVSLLPGICTAAQAVVQTNDTASGAVSRNENGLISQNKAIQIFCAAFPDITRDKDLLAEYEEQGYSQQPGWQIYDEKNGQRYDQRLINGFVNAKSGKILNMDYNPQSEFYLDKQISLTREQAQQIAKQFLVKMIPDKAGTLKLKTDDPLYSLYDRNIRLYYNFTWQREVNGMPVDWDNISIGVDSYTGLVTHYNYSWNEAELPALGELLNREQLQEKLQKNMVLVAYYRYEYDRYGQSNAKIIPVYRLNINSNSVDARSGSFLDYYGRTVSNNNLKAYDQDYMPPANAAAINETPWPTKQVDPEIAKKAAQDFFITMGYKGEIRKSGGGSSSGLGYRDEHWSYNLQDAKLENKLQVNVNAFTGEVVGFHLNNNNNSNDGKANLSYDQALSKAKVAVQKYDPDKIDEIALNRNMYGDDNSSNYNYQFARLVNGIPFNRDRIMITVDGNSGEIIAYSREWRPVQCEALPKLISLDEAKAQIWSQNALTLSYIFPRDNQYKATGESIPVYRLPSVEINACTGKPISITNENNEMSIQKETWDGHWAAPALSLLKTNGLITNKAIQADDAISRRNVLKVLLTATNPRSYYGDEENCELQLTDIPANDEDQGSFKMAINRGIIKNQGKFEPEQSITREELAVWLIKSLGLQKAAAIKNRIDTPVIDSNKISLDKVNYVGLAYGLGLITSDPTGCFQPSKNVTWAEMATIAGRIAPLAMEVYEQPWRR
ncbi:MAG: YcdB/YcdC domain-containing protein [Syntrophomonas sp.]